MPDKIDYDERNETLQVGSGRISPVPVNVWNYHEGYAKASLKKCRPIAARNEDKKVFNGLL